MTFMELVYHAKARITGDHRPQRRNMCVDEMDKELVLALAAANADHLDPEPRKPR